MDDGHVVLLSARGSLLLTGSVFVVLAELLAERKSSVAEIIEAATPRVSAPEIFYALDRLAALGAIREAAAGVSVGVQAFWDSLGVDPAAAAQRIATTTLTLLSSPGISMQFLSHSLATLGLKTGDHGDLIVTLVDDYLRPDLATLNATCLRDQTPWMPARTVGTQLWIGPLFRPWKNACWECLATRMRLHRVSETFVQRRKNYCYPRTPANESLPSIELASAGLIATEIVKWLCGTGNQIETSLLTIDVATLVTERHPVTRRPQCPSCGDREAAKRRPIRLTARAKGFVADGGHRTATPEVTLARYSHLVSPLTGVVSELIPSSGVDAKIAPTYDSGANAAKNDGSIDAFRRSFRGSSGGKGRTDSQARASALCEAIERHSGIFQGNESRVHGSFDSLEDAIHPNDCMLFSERQYERRLGNSAFRSARVPLPFDERAEIEWTPLWSLTEERFKCLPTAYCYYDYPLPPEERFCWADSNGCAAGNSVEEAILQGFLELVERDSVALWWYNRVQRPAVDLHSFDDPYFETLQTYYRSLGRDLWVLDITGDLGIPSFAAVSRRTETTFEHITLGFGAHFDPHLALVRALTEANQFLPVVIGRGDRQATENDDEIDAWLATSSLENRPYLVPAGGLRRHAGDYRNDHRDDIKEDVEACVRLAAERGLETLVLDQTRPDVGLSVVRVVVPGLRHFWARFGAGRLYDLPVALGWLPSATPEEELNPISVFF